MPSVYKLLLPERADNTLPGSQIPLYLLILVAALGTVRSFIHMLAPDGGAGSIAGMDLSTPAADGIVFAFALWGSAQLVYAILQWVVVLRYRSLVPLFWLVQLLETALRMLAPRLKPAAFAHTPPGAYQNYLYLTLAVLMLALSLWSSRRQAVETA